MPMIMMMILVQLHGVNDDDKNFWWFVDVPFSVPDDDDASSPSLSLDNIVLGYVSRIAFLLRGSIEIL